MSVAVLLLAKLKRDRIGTYVNLRGHAQSRVAGGDILFVPALSVLFLLGLIEYRPKNDSFEYVGIG